MAGSEDGRIIGFGYYIQETFKQVTPDTFEDGMDRNMTDIALKQEIQAKGLIAPRIIASGVAQKEPEKANL